MRKLTSARRVSVDITIRVFALVVAIRTGVLTCLPLSLGRFVLSAGDLAVRSW